VKIGVLALQGGVEPHVRALGRLGHEARPVRAPADLVGLDGLVLPGGESTAQRRLLALAGLTEAVRAFRGPALVTCAGLVLAARVASHPGADDAAGFGWLDVAVDRNGWGRQVASREATLDDGGPLAGARLVFIRAPRIAATGPEVEVLARWRGEPVVVRQGRVVGCTAHPELTGTLALHALAFEDGRGSVSPALDSARPWL
jgi:5'-phosphate synthase pdxT subunit